MADVLYAMAAVAACDEFGGVIDSTSRRGPFSCGNQPCKDPVKAQISRWQRVRMAQEQVEVSNAVEAVTSTRREMGRGSALLSLLPLADVRPVCGGRGTAAFAACVSGALYSSLREAMAVGLRG